MDFDPSNNPDSTRVLANSDDRWCKPDRTRPLVREHDARWRMPNRFHLVHRVILRMKEHGREFTAHDIARLVYVGRKVHPQQRARINRMLFRYLRAGFLGFRMEKTRDVFWWAPVAEPTEEQEIERERLMELWPHQRSACRDVMALDLMEYLLDEL